MRPNEDVARCYHDNGKEEDRKVLRDEGVAVVVRGVDASEGTMAEKKKIDRRRGESFWRDR